MPRYPAGVRFVDSFGRPAKPIRLEKFTEEDRRALLEQMRQLDAQRRTESCQRAEQRFWDHQAKFQEYEVAEHLDDPEQISAYFTEAFAVNDYQGIAFALAHIARAKGMSDIADKIWADLNGLSYFAHVDPPVSRAGQVLESIGLKFAVVPAEPSTES